MVMCRYDLKLNDKNELEIYYNGYSEIFDDDARSTFFKKALMVNCLWKAEI